MREWKREFINSANTQAHTQKTIMKTIYIAHCDHHQCTIAGSKKPNGHKKMAMDFRSN